MASPVEADSENFFRFIFGRKPSQSFDHQDLTYMLLGHQASVSNFKDSLISQGKTAAEIFAQSKAYSDCHSGEVLDFDTAVSSNMEYFAAHQERGDTFMWMVDGAEIGRNYREKMALLYMLPADAIVHLNFYLYRVIPAPVQNRREAIVGFGIVRVIHLLRSIRALWNTDANVESIALIRPIYEIYCFCASSIEDDGISDWIWESYFDQSSKKWKPPAPKLALIKANLQAEVEIFDKLYPELCSYVHFGMERMSDHVENDIVFVEQFDNDGNYQIFLTCFILFLLFSCLGKLPSVKGMARRDIRFMERKAARSLLDVLDIFSVGAGDVGPLEGIKVRLEEALRS